MMTGYPGMDQENATLTETSKESGSQGVWHTPESRTGACQRG